MKSFISIIIVGTFAAGVAFAAENPTLQADRQAINSACAADAQTAGCQGKEFGHGLLKCIWAYKRANRKTFKVSQACKSATKQWKADRMKIKGH